MIAGGASIADVYTGLLTPAMVRVGELWSKKKINVAQQKLATQITLSQMDKLRSLGVVKQKRPYRALVCCVAGEMHSTGARMAADLFRLQGWSVDFLGADVPMDDLVTIIQKRRPHILALSVTMQTNLKNLRRLLELLRDLDAPPKVLVGGQAGATLTRWKIGDLNVSVAPNLMEGLSLASSAFHTASPKTDLNNYLREIGQRIRELRTRTGKTQAQLAGSAGLNRAYIVSVERGKQNISVGVVIKIANALGISAEQLLVNDYNGLEKTPGRTRGLAERSEPPRRAQSKGGHRAGNL
jgi:methanogenic corrinoid protein MtbC1/transcriptional regulator with XRE-family HTH domain